ncbi:MAG: Zn-dependent alcohol dehydrogenase [bacterium]|nr:Zn-dependent alcohol dehydrogenase [bacterium]
MKAAVFRQVHQPLTIEDVDISAPGPREVLIRTVAAGVCHSDVHFYEGLYPTPTPVVLGHESAGIVEAVGSAVDYVKPGDPVITCLSVFCGHCNYCTTGRPNLCNREGLDRREGETPRLSQNGALMHQFANLSSYAEQLLVHEHAVVKVREDMPLDKAALIGCGVTTGVGAVINTAAVPPGSTVAVSGCGGVGLSAVQGAAIAGAGRIIAIDTQASKLELAQICGATDLVNASDGDPVRQVRDMTDGGVEYSFEAIGLKSTAEQAFRMLAKGGTATVIGMIPVGTNIELRGSDFLQEKKIQGSSMGSNRFRVDMPRYVDMYLSGKLKLDEMISREITLDEINDAFQALLTGEVVRQIIRFDS